MFCYFWSKWRFSPSPPTFLQGILRGLWWALLWSSVKSHWDSLIPSQSLQLLAPPVWESSNITNWVIWARKAGEEWIGSVLVAFLPEKEFSPRYGNGSLEKNGINTDQGDFPTLWNSRLEQYKWPFFSCSQRAGLTKRKDQVQKQHYLKKTGPHWITGSAYWASTMQWVLGLILCFSAFHFYNSSVN